MSDEKVAAEEKLTKFLKRVEEMARQRNLNIFAIVEDRDPQAKQKAGTVKLNLGMSRAIREAERAHKLYKKQMGGTKTGSYEDGRDLVLQAAGMPPVQS